MKGMINMKYFKAPLLLAFILFISLNTAYAGDRFQYMMSCDYFDVYIDTETIKYGDSYMIGYKDKNIIDVWGKTIYNPQGVKDVINNRKKLGLNIEGFSNLSYHMVHIKYYLDSRKFQLLSLTYYSNNGDILESFQDRSPIMNDSIPGSFGELLFKRVSQYRLDHDSEMMSR